MRLALVQSLLGRESPEIIHECRTCGEVVESDTDSCPVCGRDGIATYEIE